MFHQSTIPITKDGKLDRKLRKRRNEPSQWRRGLTHQANDSVDNPFYCRDGHQHVHVSWAPHLVSGPGASFYLIYL